MLDIPSTAYRVLNVLKQWVEKHYYDFEASPQLLRDLKAFVYGLFRFLWHMSLMLINMSK